MTGLVAVLREAFADATRRRLALSLAGVTAIGLLLVLRCTANLQGTVEVDGRDVDLAWLGPVLGIPLVGALSLGVSALAALLAADGLAGPLRSGEAHLWLARPLRREVYAAGRLGGALGLAWAVGFTLLGATTALLFVRQGLPVAPALWATGAMALGSTASAALSMSLSLAVPRVAAALFVQIAVAVIAVADVATLLARDAGGWLGVVQQVAPPLLAAPVHGVASWSDELTPGGDPRALALRLAVWAVVSVALLCGLFRRLELSD